MSNESRIDEAAKKATRCFTEQLDSAIDLFGRNNTESHFENLIYPPNVGYIYGLAGLSCDAHGLNDNRFVDVFDKMCSSIKIDGLGEEIKEAADYMILKGYATDDLFFIAGNKKGRDDFKLYLNDDEYVGLLISLSRFMAGYFPSNFNSKPTCIFEGDNDIIKNLGILRKMEDIGVESKLHGCSNVSGNYEEVIRDFEKEYRPEIYLFILSKMASSIDDQIQYERTKSMSVSTSPPTPATRDMTLAEYVSFKINKWIVSIKYGSDEEIKNTIKNYIYDNWPTNIDSIKRELFGKTNENYELSKAIKRNISRLMKDRDIRRYNFKETYVPFGYTAKQ